MFNFCFHGSRAHQVPVRAGFPPHEMSRLAEQQQTICYHLKKISKSSLINCIFLFNYLLSSTPKPESLSLKQDIMQLLFKIWKDPRERNDNGWEIVKQTRIRGDGQDRKETDEKKPRLEAPFTHRIGCVFVRNCSISENDTRFQCPRLPAMSGAISV